MEDGLLEMLKKNPGFSLTYFCNEWFFSGPDLKNIVIPSELVEKGYKKSNKGIYKEVQGKEDYLVMFCLD